MLFITHIHTYITKHNLLPPQSRIIIGLSGGPDSLFLLHLLASMRKSHSLDLIAAYLDHEWRPESAQEVLFCHNICSNLSIPFISQKISELNTSLTLNGSKEEYARRARRFFLEQIKKEHKADLIALAHHAQDQQETFFIRLMRGTTATGLCAMKPKYGTYIRPLLETNKTDILSYLDLNKITYLIDPTNNSLDYLRNRVRHQVLPALQNCDSRFPSNFQRTISNLHDTEQFLEHLTQKIFAQITSYQQGNHMLNLSLFHEQKTYMQNRLLMHFLIQKQVPFTPTSSFLHEMLRFLLSRAAKPTRYTMNGAW